MTNPRRIEVSTLPSVLQTLEKRLELVSKTLNDEIQLLIGSVQVRDSETSRKQAERATMLTLLAAVYLPLQLVTGIFGMNIAEINDGVPAWRACVVALAVAGGLTLGVFGGVWWWRKWREGRVLAGRERVRREGKGV
jgi:Mg2+ and Co2+ transporter CorA